MEKQVENDEDHKGFQEGAEFRLYLFASQEVYIQRVCDDGANDGGEGGTDDAQCGDGDEQRIGTQGDDGAHEVDQGWFVGFADRNEGVAQCLVNDPEGQVDHEDIEDQ